MIRLLRAAAGAARLGHRVPAGLGRACSTERWELPRARRGRTCTCPPRRHAAPCPPTPFPVPVLPPFPTPLFLSFSLSCPPSRYLLPIIALKRLAPGKLGALLEGEFKHR